jgi:Taurine catabolism dioxygenase TauD, TfdA family
VRTYVEAGEAAAGRPMDAAELAVLDRFEEVTKRPELMLEFTLQPGEMYFINNYTILHARTAFDDGDAEEDRRRHLLRLWLDVPQMRSVHPHIKSGGIEAVPGRGAAVNLAARIQAAAALQLNLPSLPPSPVPC